MISSDSVINLSAQPQEATHCNQSKRSPHDQSLFVVGTANPSVGVGTPTPLRTQKRTSGTKHQSGVHFNILTSEYVNSDGGRALAIRDSAIKERASLRTGHMYQKSHSVKHDIITGLDLVTPYTVGMQFKIRAPWE